MTVPVRDLRSLSEMQDEARRMRARFYGERRPNIVVIPNVEPETPRAASAEEATIPDGPFIPPSPVKPSDFDRYIAEHNGVLFTSSYLVRLVCEVTQTHPTDILSERRNARVVKARQILMWNCKRFTRHSLPQIGNRIGGRDHTTVLHGIRRVEAAIGALALSAPNADDPRSWAETLWQAGWPRWSRSR